MMQSMTRILCVITIWFVCVSNAQAAGRAYGKAFVNKLNATEEQRADLEEIRDNRTANRHAVDDLTDKIYMLTIEDDYDSMKAQEMTTQLGELIKANAMDEATRLNDFYMSLDEDQKVMWKEHESRKGNKSGSGKRTQKPDSE